MGKNSYSLFRAQDHLDIIAMGAGAAAVLGGIAGGVTYLVTKDPALAGSVTLGTTISGTTFVAGNWLLAQPVSEAYSKTKKIGKWH